MTITETFRDGWWSKWTGHDRNGYESLSAGSDDEGAGYRQLFRVGSHYGCDLRLPVPATRHWRLSFDLNLSHDWQTVDSGKMGVGVLDDRWHDGHGPIGYGTRRVPERGNGFSYRTAFKPNPTGTALTTVAAYYYHQLQGQEYGDTSVFGTHDKRGAHDRVVVEGDFDAGMLRCQIGAGATTSFPIRVSDETAVTVLWLNAYHGGKRTAAYKCACDVDRIVLEDLSGPSDAVSEPPPPVVDRHAIENMDAAVGDLTAEWERLRAQL